MLLRLVARDFSYGCPQARLRATRIHLESRAGCTGRLIAMNESPTDFGRRGVRRSGWRPLVSASLVRSGQRYASSPAHFPTARWSRPLIWPHGSVAPRAGFANIVRTASTHNGPPIGVPYTYAGCRPAAGFCSAAVLIATIATPPPGPAGAIGKQISTPNLNDPRNPISGQSSPLIPAAGPSVAPATYSRRRVRMGRTI